MVDEKDLPKEGDCKPFKFADRRLEEYFTAQAYMSKLEEYIIEFLKDNGHSEIKSVMALARHIEEKGSIMLPISKHKDFTALTDEYLAAQSKVKLLQGIAEEYYFEQRGKKG